MRLSWAQFGHIFRRRRTLMLPILCDNTTQFRDAYRDYFEFVANPQNGLRTMTSPLDGDLELTVLAD
jgi:hypothetical protein